jgi:integrase
MITTAQIAAMMAYALEQHTFPMFRLAVVIAVMATSGLRKINVLRLCRYDLFFFADRLVIFIETCKNRQTRHGSFRTIARMPDAPWCAVHLLEQYLKRTGIDIATADVDRACPIFRASRGSHTGTVLIPATWATNPIADTTMSTTFRQVADTLGFPRITFHSLRVWMASTLMAQDGLVLTKQHGDWKSDSVHTYIEHSDKDLLIPSAILSADLAAKFASQTPSTSVSVPTRLPIDAPIMPDPAGPVGADEVLISW